MVTAGGVTSWSPRHPPALNHHRHEGRTGALEVGRKPLAASQQATQRDRQNARYDPHNYAATVRITEDVLLASSRAGAALGA
jgi:hypothetical protein